MPQPGPIQGHYDLLLSNFSVAYMQSDASRIAPNVFGQMPVDYESGIFMRFPKGYWFRDNVERRPLMGEIPIAGYEIDTLKYSLDEWVVGTALDSREKANATPPYNPEQAKARWLGGQQSIHMDKLWSTSFFTTGIWGTDVTCVNSAPSSSQLIRWDQSGSNPIDDIENLKMQMALSTGYEPNVLVLGRAAFRRLRSNSYIVNRYQYTDPNVMSEQQLAGVLGIEKIVVTRSVYNSAVEKAPGATGLGTTSTTDNVSMNWTADKNSALLAYVDPNPALMQPTAGLTFVWQRLPGAGVSTSPILRSVDSYGGSLFEKFGSRMAYGHEIVAPDLGMFLSNLVDPSNN